MTGPWGSDTQSPLKSKVYYVPWWIDNTVDPLTYSGRHLYFIGQRTPFAGPTHYDWFTRGL